jgi:integrase
LDSRYAVRTVVLQSGERLPILLNSDTGSPLFEPTVYSLTELRARNRAAATIEQALRAVLVLYRFTHSHGIDLSARLAEGRLLQLGEIDELVRHCRLRLGASGHSDASVAASVLRARSTDSVWMRSAPAPLEVDASSAALRLRYIRDYVRWLATDRLQHIERSDPAHVALLGEAELVVRLLGQRIPSTASRDFVGQRQGLSPEALARLNEVVSASSAENPWKGAHARERNALIVHWLRSLGLRRGELLGIRILNINFQANEVRITRHADDPEDPRTRQPNTKTYGRLVPLDDELAQLTRQYIMGARRAIAGARKHDYLFVANGTGAPLTLGAVDHIFTALRRKYPDLPSDLSAHVLRHTWNDRFSELMDEKGVPEEIEHKMRSRLMGWSETSKTASTYTRRHVHKRAREAALQLQRSIAEDKPK